VSLVAMPYARNGDVELYYDTFGDRNDPSLLLVNGLGSQCINYADAWCEKFAAVGLFVVRFDNRDVGLSTKFADFRPNLRSVLQAKAEGREPEVPYTVHDMADDAIAVLDAVGAARAHVMGLSMGGMIVQTLAIEHPERVLSMTSVMSSTGDTDVGRPSAEAQKVFMLKAPHDRESYIERHLLNLRTWGSPAHLEESRLRANAGAAFDRCFHPEGQARQSMAISAGASRATALRDVRIPSLVLHGSEDKLIDPSGGRRTAEVIPGARFVLLDGLGHDYPPAYWDEIVRLVVEHVRGASN
jgi:pimeloyl-ACP methyl ester carboxylesterase